jgi:hypothetical protein
MSAASHYAAERENVCAGNAKCCLSSLSLCVMAIEFMRLRRRKRLSGISEVDWERDTAWEPRQEMNLALGAFENKRRINDELH